MTTIDSSGYRRDGTVHIVLPNDIDDPAEPSGGNRYDRRICDGLRALGWTVHEHPVHGPWPEPAAAPELARTLDTLPDEAVTLIDGLIASAVPEVLAPQANRLRIAVLMHMPIGDERERRALAAAQTVIATSQWCKTQLLHRYELAPDQIHVATPGVAAAPMASGSPAGTELLCVGAVTPVKGHDILVEALATLTDLQWHCVCAGSLTREPAFAARLYSDRINFVGALTEAELATRYAATDLLVLPSRSETYGMVVTEALARGVPVLAADVGGVSEALGRAPDGSLPGMLVPAEDPATFADALRLWLTEADFRQRLRRSARERRTTLTDWTVTATQVAASLRNGVPAWTR